MKFSFKIAIICANFCITFGQYWGSIFPIPYPSSYSNPYQNSYPNLYSSSYPNSIPNRNDENIIINKETSLPTSLSLNSCESYWEIQNDGNGVWGLLSLNSPNREQAIIKVILTLAAALPTRYVGDIDLLKSKESTSADVSVGLPIEYRIRFPLQHPIPKLTELYYNDQLLCRGQKAVGTTVTTITLDHTFYTGLSNNGYYGGIRPTPRPGKITHPTVTQQTQTVTYRPVTYEPQTQQPRTQKPTTRPTPVITRPTTERQTSINDKLDILNSLCGKPYVNFKNVTSLIVNGKMALRGQFPWLAAYYHNDEGFNGFLCGGSLVSEKIVITAAHCINDKTDPKVVRKPEQAIIYLGKHNLKHEERGFLSSGAIEFIMHPDWNAEADSYDGDIAAIVLLRTIQFTALIQPICLWDSTNNYADIINHKGIVAGYGKTQTSVAESNVPYWSELPVVEERTCLDSSEAFLKLTSRRTFCGGNKDGTGPCNGDSGGAFIISSDNKYYLRGIVSSSLLNPSTFLCDTSNYAVFTDTAAFKDWIYTQIGTYG